MDTTLPRECHPRYSTPRTDSRQTLGAAAARIAERLNMPLMPWQRQVVDTALEVEHGQFVYREVILTIPRQQGKSTLMLVLILTRALMAPNQRIVFTAQTRADARKMWSETWMPTLEASEFVEHYKARLANGDESLLFDNGSRQGLVASTLKAGHGQTLDLAIVDEAFAQTDSRLEQALKPTMLTRSKLPHRGPQFWVVSTAGTLLHSPYLWAKVENGRVIAEAGHNRSVAYFEWSASDDEDPADEETWWRTMPALGRTVDLDAVRADFMSMELHEFERAMLNRWTSISVDPVFPIADWKKLTDRSINSTGVPVSIAADITPLRDYAAVAASGTLADGRQFVEVIEHKAGTDWVAPFVERLIESNQVSSVVIDPAGPAVTLVDQLTKRNVDFEVGIGKMVSTRQACDAFASFCDAVTQADHENPRFVHKDQQVLASALDGAVARPVGDGGQAWGRKSSGVDISPLVACTLAFWGAREDSVGNVWNLDRIAAEILAQRQGEQQGPQTLPSTEPQEPSSVNGGQWITPL